MTDSPISYETDLPFTGEKGIITFEMVFNRHLDRMNKTIPEVLNNNMSPLSVLSVFSNVKILNGLIIGGHANAQYIEKYNEMERAWKSKWPIEKIGKVGSLDKNADQYNAITELLEIYQLQMGEVERLGLTRPKEVAVYNSGDKSEDYTMTEEDNEMLEQAKEE